MAAFPTLIGTPTIQALGLTLSLLGLTMRVLGQILRTLGLTLGVLALRTGVLPDLDGRAVSPQLRDRQATTHSDMDAYSFDRRY